MSAAGRHRRPERHGRRVAGTVVGVLVALAAIVGVQFPTAYGAYIAKITNNTNSVGTNPFFTCAAAQGGTANGAYFTYPLDDNGSLLGGLVNSSATDISGNSRTGSYNTSGVSYQQPNADSPPVCRRDTRTVVKLDGSQGAVYASGALTAAVSGPAQFTVEIWFKTTAAQGKLIGFGNSRTGTSSQYDRHLFIEPNGDLAFGVYAGANKTIRSSAPVTDGRWHHAVGTLSSTAGMTLYLDGKDVAADTTTTTAETDSGYWRIGYDNLNGWTTGTNYHVNGELAFASVYTSALSATTVAQHYAAGR